MADEYDSPWKEILEQYFEQFMDFFFPQAHAEIDWARGYEFKDKEFQQITKEADTRRRYVDKLVKVWMMDGSEAWGLIHTDIQNWPEMDFAERMYIYNYRIFDRFRRPVASLAVLGGMPKTRTVNRYDRSLWGCYQQFGFPVVNLNDFATRTEELKASANPFALVVMAYNLARQTRRQKTTRLPAKLSMIRHLYQKGFSRQDIINLFRFIDWVISLPEEEDDLFWKEIAIMEKEGTMPYITSVERIGYRRGLLDGEKRGEKRGQKLGHKQGQKQGQKLGKKVGLKDGQVSLLARQIARKFKSKISLEKPLLDDLELKDLRILGEKILDFKTLDEVHAWIGTRTNRKGAE